MYFLDKSSYTYENCNRLREAGVFVNSKYKLKDQSDHVECVLWGKYRNNFDFVYLLCIILEVYKGKIILSLGTTGFLSCRYRMSRRMGTF